MAARAADLGDVGESAPENWERPLGTADVHVAISVLAPDSRPARSGRGAGTRGARGSLWRRGDLAAGLLPACDGRTSFGFKDGIGQPSIEGSGIDGTNPHQAADQGRRVPARLSGRDRRAATDADTGGARPERDLHRLPKAAHARRRVPPLHPREAQPTGKTSCCSARRWSVAGRAARRCRSAPTWTSRELGGDRRRNNAFSTATIPGDSSAHWARTRDAPIRATRSTMTEA